MVVALIADVLTYFQPPSHALEWDQQQSLPAPFESGGTRGYFQGGTAALLRRMEPTPFSGPADLPGELSIAATRVRFSDMPAPLRRRLVDHFDAWSVDRRPARLRDRIKALLDVDTGLTPALAGLRGAGTDTGRQLLFTSDVADIAINVRDANVPAVLDGQVLPAEGDDAVYVELLLDGEVVAEVAADDTGSFLVEGVPAGAYTLVVSVGDREIEVGPVEVAVA